MTQTLNNFYKRVINSYQRYRTTQANIRELSKLSRRELTDIGVSADISFVARQNAEQRYPYMKGYHA